MSNADCGEHHICLENKEQNNECVCQIDVNDRPADKSCKCRNGTFDGEKCITTCDIDTDCNGGRCLTLPGNKHKSCYCPIELAGEKCERARTCDDKLNPYQKPCLNGGECLPVVTKKNSDVPYTCNCMKTWFYGDYCEKVHPCHPLKVKVSNLKIMALNYCFNNFYLENQSEGYDMPKKRGGQ